MSSSNGNMFQINNSVLSHVKTAIFKDNVNLKRLNSGKNGIVFNITQSKNKVLKITKAKNNNKNEGIFASIASKFNIGPKLYNNPIIVNGYSAILQEKMEGTLKDYLEKYTFTMEDYNQISFLVTVLHNKDVCHNDLHIKNIMYKMVQNKPVFKLIDFSRATYKSNSGGCGSDMSKLGDLKRLTTPKSPAKRFKNYSTTPKSPAKRIKPLSFTSNNYRTP